MSAAAAPVADAVNQCDVDLRSAAAGDAADVASLLGLLGYPCDAAEAAERIAEVASDPRQSLVLASVDGQACGLIALDTMYYLPLGMPTCRVTALVVMPEAQRSGVGRRLLKDAERRARAHGAARLELTSAAHRTDAHAFYRACGFGDGALRFVKSLGD